MSKTKVTKLAGNLYAVTLPAASGDESDRTYAALKTKCGGAEPASVLSKTEIAGLPAGRTLVLTADGYIHLVPVYCPLT